MPQTDRAAGVLLGLACGDALGRPVEFKPADAIAKHHGTVDEMLGHGTHGKPAGTITDDTELALRITRSLAEQGAFDGADVAERFVEWYESGPFDIGMMTADALRKIQHGTSWTEAGQTVWEGRAEGRNAGNGSVMRCAPYAVAFAKSPETVLDVSKQSSAITHADPRCTYGCALLNSTIANLLYERDEPLRRAIDRIQDDAPDELIEAVEAVADSSTRPNLQTSGYVVHTLQTALYDGLTADSAKDGIVTAVNRGGDTDTVGAVTGAIVGAKFGAIDLPKEWIQAVGHADELEDLGKSLAKNQFETLTPHE